MFLHNFGLWDGPWYSPDGPDDPWDQKKIQKICVFLRFFSIKFSIS